MGAYKGKYLRPQKRSYQYIWILLMGLAAGLIVFTVSQREQAKDSLRMPLGWGSAIVLSDSMKPTFRKGDLLIMRKQDDIHIGDVVVYESGKSLVVHRVITLDGDTVITKGDANNSADDPFQRDRIRAVVAGRIPGFGKLVQQIQTPIGTLVLAMLPMVLVEVGTYQNRYIAKKSKKQILVDISGMREEMNRKFSKMEE